MALYKFQVELQMLSGTIEVEVEADNADDAEFEASQYSELLMALDQLDPDDFNVISVTPLN